MEWKTLSSEYLFSDLWFKVRKDKCETPGGKIVDPYYVYEFPTWVTALPITEDGKTVTKEKRFEGTKEEVDSAIDVFVNENVDVPPPPKTPSTQENS